MQRKQATRFLIVLGLAAGLGRAEPFSSGEPASPAPAQSSQATDAAPPPSSLPPQAPAPAAWKVVDLDFSDDFPARPVSPRKPRGTGVKVARPLPAPVVQAPPPPSRAWMYWTLGLGAVAAGGAAAVYLHMDMAKTPAPGRSDQVFTDAPD